MSLVNATSAIAMDVPTYDARGRHVLVVVLKSTFVVHPSKALVLADAPAPVRLADVPWDPERESSVRLPTDLVVEKAATDVVVVGSAFSRKPVTRLDLLVRVGRVDAPLVVHGPRVFRGSVGGAVGIGPAEPFVEVPVVYELAFGGTVLPERDVADERNPIGVGVARRPSDLHGRPAPRIEHPERPHRDAADQHPPMGYGATSPHWLPRREHAGTFDASWRATRMPLLPADHDARFENLAHPSLQVGGERGPFLDPGTAVAIQGMRLEGPLTFALPDEKLVVHGRWDHRKESIRPGIDTVVVEPTTARVEVVRRAVFPIGRGAQSLREVRVDRDG